ncbi:layilin-like [Ptychodera flava]|uniref:layilin-like n=1 Tax=Ptychodera flava TaxID=63121 RepID=UPI00396A5F10
MIAVLKVATEETDVEGLIAVLKVATEETDVEGLIAVLKVATGETDVEGLIAVLKVATGETDVEGLIAVLKVATGETDVEGLLVVLKVATEETDGEGLLVVLKIATEKKDSAKIFLNELSYGDARAACRADNGMLATVDSYYVQNLLETNIENENVGDLVDGFWIGLDDCNMEGTFSWRDGTVLTGNCYQNWFGDHSHNNRDCVAISKSKSYKWDDFACSMEMGYICMYYNCDNRDVQCQQCAELPPEPMPGGGD